MWPLNIKFNTYGFLKGLIDGYGHKKGRFLIAKTSSPKSVGPIDAQNTIRSR